MLPRKILKFTTSEQYSPQANFKAWRLGKIWVKPQATSKQLYSSHSHIKGKSILKACWADIPYICWGEHWSETASGDFWDHIYNDKTISLWQVEISGRIPSSKINKSLHSNIAHSTSQEKYWHNTSFTSQKCYSKQQPQCHYCWIWKAISS